MIVNGDISVRKITVGGDISTGGLTVGGNISLPAKVPYEGDYTITPTEAEQTIPIKGKSATQDITVEGIPSNYVGSAVPREQGKTVTPTEAQQTAVDSGRYTTGIVRVAAISPTYVGSQVPRAAGGIITPTKDEQTAILAGRYTEGDIKVAPAPILADVLRLDAEKIDTYSGDYMLVEDKGVTIPAYSTAAVTVLAAEALTPKVTIDYENYNYYIAERFLTIPEYNIATKAKGREEYQWSSYLYEVVEIPANSLKALIDGKVYTSRNVAVVGQGHIRQLYWSSGTAIAVYTATTYGIAQVAATPSISSGTMTINAPSVSMRGSSTYFASTYWNALTDARCQYAIDVYRAPKNHLNLDGWGDFHQCMRIIDCINSPSHDLV